MSKLPSSKQVSPVYGILALILVSLGCIIGGFLAIKLIFFLITVIPVFIVAIVFIVITMAILFALL